MAIRHKRTTTTGYTWQSADTVEGQIGLNLTDGTLHFKKANGDYVALSQGGGGITDIVQDTTPQLGGNLDVNGNKIISASNANIELEPNGTGDVYLTADTIRVGDSDATVTIKTNGAGGNLVLETSGGVQSRITLNDGSNGTILFEADGDIQANADGMRLGQANANATLTTNGTGDLILNTNSGTNSGSITIEDGVNGNILLTPNGTGKVVITEIIAPTGLGGDVSLSPDGTGNVNLNADTVRIGDNNENATLTTHGTGDLILNTNGGSNSGSITIADGVNGDITLAPNGTGKIVISGDLQIDGTTTTVNSTTLDVDDINITIAKGAANAAAANGGGITLEGPTTAATITYASSDDSWNFNKKTSAPELQIDNININANNITSTDTNGSIFIEPNGTGDVAINADTLRVGDQNLAATITTWGTGQLTLSTDSTAAGKPRIDIPSSTSGNLNLVSSSTGVILFSGVSVGQTSSTTNGVGAITGRSIQTASNTLQRFSLVAQKQRTDIALASMTDEPAVIGFQVRDSAGANRTFATQRATYTGTGANPIIYFDCSTDNYTTTVATLNFNHTRAVWGNGGTYTHTTNGAASIKLNSNNGTNSGEILINQGANGNIEITPNGTGKTVIKNLQYNEGVFAYGNSGALTWTPDVSVAGNIVTMTLTGNLTFNAFQNPVSGQTLTVILTQDATGGRTLTSTMKFAGGSKTLSTAANAIDILTVSYIGTTYYATLSKGYA